MTTGQMRKLLQAKPLHPFAIRTTDGVMRRVRHPELAMLTADIENATTTR